MKKYLQRISKVILYTLILLPNLCFADLIIGEIEPIVKFRPIAYLIGIIGAVVLAITLISFFILKLTASSKNLTDEEILKRKNSIFRRFYIWSIILSVVALIYVYLSADLSIIIYFIPIILFIVSFVFRVCKKKRISNIICCISVIIVCVIAVCSVILNKNIESYNQQFLQYQEEIDVNRLTIKYTSNVEGLINTAIQNNESNRKVTLIYQNVLYTSVSELNELLNELDINKRYTLKISYNGDYIEFITLSIYTD